MSADRDFNRRYKEAKKEFISIVNTYMLPLFDVRGKIKCVEKASNNTELISIEEGVKGTSVHFYPCVANEKVRSPFYCEVGIYSSAALKKPAIRILRELLKTTEYEYWEPFALKRHYGKKGVRQLSYKTRTLDLAFELGMCQWLTPTMRDAVTLHTIICRMIEWSSRTYEGKNVPFGIVVDFGKTVTTGAADYLHFLENDSSAVFTDGIFSGIMLDKMGKIICFLTRNSTPPDQRLEQEIFVPYQFIDIARHCVDEKIGIIVLTNGEILLIKNQAVCFAKRGRKWVYFDWTRVYSKLRPYFLCDIDTTEEIIRKKIQSIYCTLLDVSFSHTGGCLSIVHPNKAKALNEEKIVADRFDLYSEGNPLEGMSSENKEKAEILSYLLRYPEQQLQSFFELEKPLRREILSLDGATVVSLNGSFYCAGSIVAVPGGSSAGGRTAAAKQLAKFGVGIKISEDGYIEAYGIPVNNYGALNTLATSRIVPLFKFK